MKIPGLNRTATVIILVMVMTLGFRIEGRIIVLPFQVRAPEKMDHQWLGRAISFYLTKGLELNSFETHSDMKVHSILNTYNINFPYIISKASGIKLSIIFRANFLVWGEVISSENPESYDAQIRASIIDLTKLSQKYLPLIKFHIRDFYLAQNELLNLVTKYFQKTSITIPELGMDYHGYENFIKSLLLTDPQKKIALLESTFPHNPDSELINFELAQWYLNTGDLKKSEQYLNTISGKEALKPDERFLAALHSFYQGNRGAAQKIFSDLEIQKKYISETLNNLGIIFCQNNEYDRAESYFIQSLQETRDPVVFCNYISLLMKSAQNEKARATLNTALFYFPDDENLIELFSFFVSHDPNRDQLIKIFQKYIPEISLDTKFPAIPDRLKNPFELQTYDNLYYLPDIEKNEKLYYQGEDTESIKNSEKLLEINPFIPGLHRLLLEIYQKKKDSALVELFKLSYGYLKSQNQI